MLIQFISCFFLTFCFSYFIIKVAFYDENDKTLPKKEKELTNNLSSLYKEIDSCKQQIQNLQLYEKQYKENFENRKKEDNKILKEHYNEKLSLIEDQIKTELQLSREKLKQNITKVTQLEEERLKEELQKKTNKF